MHPDKIALQPAARETAIQSGNYDATCAALKEQARHFCRLVTAYRNHAHRVTDGVCWRLPSTVSTWFTRFMKRQGVHSCLCQSIVRQFLIFCNITNFVTIGLSVHGVSKKQNLPAFCFEKIRTVLLKSWLTFSALQRTDNAVRYVVNSDEVCMRFCPSSKSLVLYRGCGRVICTDKTDEQDKLTFSLMFTCGIYLDPQTNEVKGFYGLPGFVFTGKRNGHLDKAAWQRMHDVNAGSTTPFIGFNTAHYFNSDRFNNFVHFLMSQANHGRVIWFIDSATTHLTPKVRETLSYYCKRGRLYPFFLPRCVVT